MTFRPNRYRLSALLFLVVGALMATILAHTPPQPVRYLYLAQPYVFLFALWIGFDGTAADASKLEEKLDLEDKRTVHRLRTSYYLQTIFGVGGIAFALAAGWSLGHMSIH